MFRSMCVTSPAPRARRFWERHRCWASGMCSCSGGAHAIAAFAFGTKTVPRADRIVGPGNIYVAAAKKLLAGEVGIDFIAGPTEILMIANEGEPSWIAADMLAQAEHDTEASAILLTTSKRLAQAVAKEIERNSRRLPTGKVAQKAIDKNSAIILVKSDRRSCRDQQPLRSGTSEHSRMRRLLPGIRHAGSIFIGPHSPEAAGDYASGPNHVLPTSGAARLRGGLSAADYVKVISTQELSARRAATADAGHHDAGPSGRAGSARPKRGGALSRQ